MAKITEKQKANLRPFNTLTVNEQRKIKKSAKKSVEVRAQRKTFKLALEQVLSTIASEKWIHNRAMKRCFDSKLSITWGKS